MNLIDTHCHLAHPRLAASLDDVLARARQAGVTAFVCAAGNVQDSRAALAIARREANVYCLAGVHPHDAKDAGADDLAELERLLGEPKTVALGEAGLDYHYNFSPPEDQRRVFAEQLALARRLGRHVVVHTREAFGDTLAILRDSGLAGADVLFHSCTEPPENVRAILDFGATVSYSGIVTFANAADVRAGAALVPPDRLLIETDAPYLSPEPVRKMKTNEPANVAHVATFLASERKTSPEALAEQTTANAVCFFGLPL